jgi:hypothetical protein
LRVALGLRSPTEVETTLFELTLVVRFDARLGTRVRNY